MQMLVFCLENIVCTTTEGS